MPDLEEKSIAKKLPVAAVPAGYSHERLITDADSFTGYPAHVVVGALAGVKKQNLSADETKTLVEKWLLSEAN